MGILAPAIGNNTSTLRDLTRLCAKQRGRFVAQTTLVVVSWHRIAYSREPNQLTVRQNRVTGRYGSL